MSIERPNISIHSEKVAKQKPWIIRFFMRLPFLYRFVIIAYFFIIIAYFFIEIGFVLKLF